MLLARAAFAWRSLSRRGRRASPTPLAFPERSLCTGHLAGKSGPELGRLLGVVSDFPTEAERQAATEEPLYTQDAEHDATARRAADDPTPPAPVCWLSTQL